MGSVQGPPAVSRTVSGELLTPGSSGPASLLSSVSREVVGIQVVVGGAGRQAVVSVQEALRMLDRLQAVIRRVRVRLKRAAGRGGFKSVKGL